MKTVRDVLKRKGSEVTSVGPDTTVYDALKLMADANIGALVVVDGGRPIGMFTERDYARQVILKGKNSRDTAVREIMVGHVLFVAPQQNLDECMALMTDKRVRHLPVLEHDRMIGILSIGDVVKAVIDDKQFLIEQLATYIQRG
jgi:CBS domain-containing protein